MFVSFVVSVFFFSAIESLSRSFDVLVLLLIKFEAIRFAEDWDCCSYAILAEYTVPNTVITAISARRYYTFS